MVAARGRKSLNNFHCHPFAESDTDHHCRRLRSHRDIGAHRARRPGLQLQRHGAASLERHAGQSPQTHRPVAHAAGAAREELSIEHCELKWNL